MTDTGRGNVIEMAQYLRRQWRLITAICLAITTIAVITVFILPRKYDASVLFLISEPKLELSARYVEPVQLRNYAQLLLSNTVLSKTLEDIRGKLKAPPEHLSRTTLGHMLDVTIERDSHLVKLTVRANHPRDAATIANSVAKNFVAHVRSILGHSARNIQNLVRAQIDETKAKLDEVDEKLQSFFKKNNITNITIERELNLKKIDALSSELTKKQAQLQGLQASIADLEAVLKEEPPFLEVKSYIGKKPIALEATKGKRGGRSQKPTTIIETVVNKRYQTTWQKLSEERATMAALTLETAHISSEIAKLKEIVAKYPNLELEYKRLDSQSTLYKELLQNLHKQFDEATILVASKSGDVGIVDPAVAPELPSAPNRTQTVIFAFFISLVLAVFFLLLLRSLSRSISTARDEQ